jgi:hypothetical protein
MPQTVEIGQHWSTWVPSRRQWLLATVIRRADGQATLQYHQRYKISEGYNECRADEITMLTACNLFRLVQGD